MQSTFKKGALVVLLMAPLALAACTPATSTDAPSGSTAPSTDSASQPSNSSTAESGTGPVTNPKSEYLIQATKSAQSRKGYDKVSAACQATAVRYTLASLGMVAPMLEASKPGSVQKIKDAIAEVQGTTPKEFDAAFAKLEAPAKQGSATPDATAMEQDGKAIASYLETTCKELGTAVG